MNARVDGTLVVLCVAAAIALLPSKAAAQGAAEKGAAVFVA